METDNEKAIRLLNTQMKELDSVRGLNYRDAQFKSWRDSTRCYLEKFLDGDLPFVERFRGLNFVSMQMIPHGAPPNYLSPEDRRYFTESCQTAETTLRAALKYIEEFGVKDQSPTEPSPKRGAASHGGTTHIGLQQNIYGGGIRNQSIATDNAIQNIEHMGDSMGASLKEIAEAFKQSEELTQREVKEGLAAIEGLAVEVQKPDARQKWKSVLDYGQVVLTIADKATDLAHKLAPYLPHVVTLTHTAKHALGM